MEEFHRRICGDIKYPCGHDELDQVLKMQGRRYFSIKLTHGDLALHKILCTGDGKISTIVDWDQQVGFLTTGNMQ